VLSIPSHDPAYREALFGLVTAHRAELLAAPKLIIDLRGNEGGSSWLTDTVLPFIMSAPQRPAKELPDDPQILSSADMRKYVREHAQNIVSESLSAVRLIARLDANPGELVPVEDSIDGARNSATEAKRPPAALAAEAEAPGPRRVALLIDGGTVSAAEVFLRRARRSTRVTVYGENTAGALDYMSVIIVRIGDPGRRWALGFPTIAARPDLPHGGMRGVGMPPDVRVDWSTVPDAIGYVDAALSR
jgi:C-terminal processing protease CtpA/Prc